jgi:hypothetical protein
MKNPLSGAVLVPERWLTPRTGEIFEQRPTRRSPMRPRPNAASATGRGRSVGQGASWRPPRRLRGDQVVALERLMDRRDCGRVGACSSQLGPDPPGAPPRMVLAHPAELGLALGRDLRWRGAGPARAGLEPGKPVGQVPALVHEERTRATCDSVAEVVSPTRDLARDVDTTLRATACLPKSLPSRDGG